ncbi:hypothetical protein BDD43_4123 [Mucilaginibacter gracilis]|uniref:S1/P1 nuclease n=1 Tax=Mucilaginibacter gracilis TaxID=423350 RepID=A0A495J661_9SPHI|nr:zinc dependent phospholipase C family protein [Mucilaginibacter gracilis]RKR83908.1 hypothetical protein BDD43_4123 [Mucilaginibacter gracilis]
MTTFKKPNLRLWHKTAIFCLALSLISWGKYGHEHINRAVVMSLPQPMQSFFYNHIDFFTTEANLPDVRKYTIGDTAEFPRHHIHLEAYGNYDEIPRSTKDAKTKYGAKFLTTHGILPWYIQDMMAKLTAAFKGKHKSDILLLSADLGHYIGDAYMPLHTSENHNGQLTNQKGIHGLFEAQLPELFGNTYNYNAGSPRFIDDVQKETWRIVKASNSTADTLLQVDRDLVKQFGGSNVYEMENGKVKVNMYSDVIHTAEYSKAYHTKLNGMVERQLRGAIASTASFIYTAWVNAGKPDLTDLDNTELTQRNATNLMHDRVLFKSGKLFGLKSEKEF